MRKPKPLQITDPGEAAFLAQVVVRRVRPDELARCRELVCEHHYLHTAGLVGEQLGYVAAHQGRWLALLGWTAAAYHRQGRDPGIGWHASQRRARLRLLANNARFCLLPPTSAHPNLAKLRARAKSPSTRPPRCARANCPRPWRSRSGQERRRGPVPRPPAQRGHRAGDPAAGGASVPTTTFAAVQVVTVLGILRRAAQGEYHAWARGQPCQRDRTFSTDAARMSRRINQPSHPPGRRPAGGTLEPP